MKYIPDDYGERCRFDAFCKTVLRNEARTYLRDLCRQRKQETKFSSLSQYEMDKLCTRTLYDLDGSPRVRVDEYMKRRLQSRLIRAILNSP